MVDQLTQASPQPEAPAKGGFMASLSPQGRLVAGAIAGGVLLAVLALAAFIFLGYQGKSDDLNAQEVPATGRSASRNASGTAAEEESATPADPVPSTAVFTFRDVFRSPLKKAEESAAASTEPSSSTDTSRTPALDPGTLYLQDITSEDDTAKAVLALGGETYTLAAGQRIPNTPWKVLEVRDGAVVMLYGDSRIVLSVGQGQGSSSTK